MEIDVFQDVLPATDEARVAAEGGPITLQEYRARLARRRLTPARTGLSAEVPTRVATGDPGPGACAGGTIGPPRRANSIMCRTAFEHRLARQWRMVHAIERHELGVRNARCAISRASSNGMRASSRVCTTSVGHRMASRSSETSHRANESIIAAAASGELESFCKPLNDFICSADGSRPEHPEVISCR
ncbi:MAG: hypothetical protein R3E48_09305 [Burkholderiaceae bacterium]